MNLEAPYVRMDVDILDVLPFLKGSIAHVFLTVGAFSADPIAPSFGDITSYSGASKPSVSAALQFLCKHELVRCFADRKGTKRYRAARFFHYSAKEPVSVRSRIEIGSHSLDDDVGKKFFYRHDDDVLNETRDDSVQTSFIHGSSEPEESETADILEEWIHGRNLDVLAAKVSPRVAHSWARWLENVDRKRWRNPEGYCFVTLNKTPTARPPFVKREPAEPARAFRIVGPLAEVDDGDD